MIGIWPLALSRRGYASFGHVFQMETVSTTTFTFMVTTGYRHVICEDNCADDSISTNPRMKQNATEPSRTLPRLITGSRSLSNIVGTPWDTTQRYRIKATNIESKMSVGPTLEKSLIS